MKKVFFLALLSAFSMAEMQADENEGLMTVSSSTDSQVIKTTFYGSKASSNPNNPCKGATIRVCGVIEQSFDDVSMGDTPLTLVKIKVKDAYGNLTSESQRVELCTVAEAKAKIISGSLKGAIVYKKSNDD